MKNFIKSPLVRSIGSILLEIVLLVLVGWLFADSLNRARDESVALTAFDGYFLLISPILFVGIMVGFFLKDKAGNLEVSGSIFNDDSKR